MQEKLFVYGTLKNPEIQEEIIGRVVNGISATLKGYKKSRIKIEGKSYPIVVSDKNSSVSGVIISITAKELKLIDDYETHAYRRKEVVLDGSEKVWVYVK